MHAALLQRHRDLFGAVLVGGDGDLGAAAGVHLASQPDGVLGRPPAAGVQQVRDHGERAHVVIVDFHPPTHPCSMPAGRDPSAVDGRDVDRDPAGFGGVHADRKHRPDSADQGAALGRAEAEARLGGVTPSFGTVVGPVGVRRGAGQDGAQQLPDHSRSVA